MHFCSLVIDWSVFFGARNDDETWQWKPRAGFPISLVGKLHGKWWVVNLNVPAQGVPRGLRSDRQSLHQLGVIFPSCQTG